MQSFLARWMGESASAHGPALDQMNAALRAAYEGDSRMLDQQLQPPRAKPAGEPGPANDQTG